MTQHSRVYFALAITSLLVLAGCSTGAKIGSAPSDPPPQIAFLGARDAQGNDYLTWENFGSFGPVPAELQQTGDDACRAISAELRAGGYHPAAKDRKGNTIPGGGYFCQTTLQGK